MKINDLLLKRVSSRAFDVKYDISDEQILTITESMRLSPAAYGLLCLRAIVIKRNEKIRSELLPLFYNQQNVKTASAIVLLIVSDFDKLIEKDIPYYISKFEKNTSVRVQMHGERILTDLTYAKTDPKFINFTHKEAYIALGASLAVAEDLGIDTCPIDGCYKDKIRDYLIENKFIEPDEIFATSILLGKTTEDKTRKQKIRLEKEIFTKIHE